MNTPRPTLGSTIAALEACHRAGPETARFDGDAPRPDAAVAELHLSLNARDPLIPAAYLEPLRRNERLDRSSAALLLDTAARACVDAQSIGTRLAVITAHRIRDRRVYQRLGYRTDGDYAREQLGITPRAFRDLARLGGRLEELPATKAAFLDGEITRTQAEILSATATDEDEARWLAQARGGTVRGLKAAIREAREQSARGAGVDEDTTAIPMIVDGTDDDPRRRRSFDVPAELLGKIDTVLELAARVAGTVMPPGALWELVAAEYLSGVPPEMSAAAFDGAREAVADAPGGWMAGVPSPETSAAVSDRTAAATFDGNTGNTSTRASGERAAATEDPRGVQAFLERESRSWCFLPSGRPTLDLHGEWMRLRSRCTADEDRSAWDLHRDMTASLHAERRIAWQLGRLLVTIRNRRLWRSMMFASFGHYVRERLGISPRVVDRLIRIDREGWNYPALQRAYQEGELSPLVAETLVRVFRHVGFDHAVQQAWIDFARGTTFQRLSRVVRAAERQRARRGSTGRRPLGPPSEALLPSDDASGTRLDSTQREPHEDSPTFVTSTYAVWMTDDEYEVLERAIGTVQRSSSERIPIGECLKTLLDHFVGEYDGAHAQRMREKHALLDRDGWQCQVPGCAAYGPLHLHHIVFRSHGGGDEPKNLVTLCDFHHKALHDGWIQCAGRAPETLYWELGVDRADAPAEPPVERIAGHRRLDRHEYWDGHQVRRIDTETMSDSGRSHLNPPVSDSGHPTTMRGPRSHPGSMEPVAVSLDRNQHRGRQDTPSLRSR